MSRLIAGALLAIIVVMAPISPAVQVVEADRVAAANVIVQAVRTWQSEAGFLDGNFRCYAYEPGFIWLAWVPSPENFYFGTANQWCIETDGGRL